MALTDNLSAFWELEEASGTRNDAHSTNHLTDNATVTQNTGKVGNCAQFTAANSEYLSITDNVPLSTGDIDFTIAAWVYLDTKNTFRAFISKAEAIGSRDYTLIYWQSEDRFKFIVFYDASSNSLGINADNLGSPSTATWYYIVAWHDSSANTLNIQVNNGTVNSVSHTSGAYDSTAPFLIGQYSPNAFFMDGRIDQVGFWKRVLTTQERTDLYNGGSGLSYAAMSGGSSPTLTPAQAAASLTGTSNRLGLGILMPDEL